VFHMQGKRRRIANITRTTEIQNKNSELYIGLGLDPLIFVGVVDTLKLDVNPFVQPFWLCAHYMSKNMLEIKCYLSFFPVTFMC
jgi:hypothetical protein